MRLSSASPTEGRITIDSVKAEDTTTTPAASPRRRKLTRTALIPQYHAHLSDPAHQPGMRKIGMHPAVQPFLQAVGKVTPESPESIGRLIFSASPLLHGAANQPLHNPPRRRTAAPTYRKCGRVSRVPPWLFNVNPGFAVATRTMNAPRINLVVLRVADIDRAAAFYRLLGFAFSKHAHGTGPQHYASDAEGFVFELYPATSEEVVSSSTRIGFAVTDVDDATAKLGSFSGARIVATPKDSEWGRRAVVADPDGHRIELVAAAGRSR